MIWRSLINLRRLNNGLTDPTFSDLSFYSSPEDGGSIHSRREPSEAGMGSRLSAQFTSEVDSDSLWFVSTVSTR